MKQNGRKPAEKLVAARFVEPKARPQAPDRLSAEEKAHWNTIVDRMPADWFQDENLPMLERLVCTYRTASILEQQLRKWGSKANLETQKGQHRFGQLSRMHAIQTKMIAVLSTKLRLAISHRTTPDTPRQIREMGSGEARAVDAVERVM